MDVSILGVRDAAVARRCRLALRSHTTWETFSGGSGRGDEDGGDEGGGEGSTPRPAES